MAKHINNLQIETYRGIRNLRVENLGCVNIFVGDNNTGKTSVLEAIQLLCDPNEYNLIKIARQREKYKAAYRMGLSILDSVLFLFDVNSECKSEDKYNIHIGGTINEKDGAISISGEVVNQIIDLAELSKNNRIARNIIFNNSMLDEQEETATFIGKIDSTFTKAEQVKLLDNGNEKFEINMFTTPTKGNEKNRLLKVRMVQTLDHIIEDAFSELIRSKKIKEQAVELLKEFDEDIIDIRYINDKDRFSPVIETVNREYIPLSLYGDGMKKALTMINSMVNTRDGVVLIDEFETALHTSAMSKVFKFILDVAYELNIQLFFTTHSIEAVDKLLGSCGDKLQDIRIIRLKKKKGTTFAKVTNGDEALNDRIDYNMELRI